MGLEPYEGRYTLQLQDWSERVYKKRGIDYAIRHVEEAKALSRELGGNDKDVKDWFFSKSKSELQRVFSSYRTRYGDKAADYAEDAFPEWKNDILMGTLKSMQLFRFSFDGNRVIEQEILLDDFARVRDIESGIDGEVYLLLENGAGSKIARLMPMPVEVSE